MSRLLIIAMMCAPASAAVFDMYHPKSPTLVVTETSLNNVTAFSTFYYTTSQINDIRLANNLDEYATVEHRSDPNQKAMMGIPTDTNYYTTLPNPYYDREDDLNDGWLEESEITILGKMTANKTYEFASF